MSVLQAIVLGIVQGATEFLPISSSGHLVLVPWALGWQLDPDAFFAFSVLVHWGTLSAVVLYFRNDLIRITRAAVRGLRRGRPLEESDSRLAWLIGLASTPAAIVGVAARGAIESAFVSPVAVSVFLLVTAALLLIGQRLKDRELTLATLGGRDSVSIGIAQALALLPGISRSGSTIAAGLFRGLDRQSAARFSFLLSVPIMIGAGLQALVELVRSAEASTQAGPLILGFTFAAVIGYAAIHWLLAYLGRRPLTLFVIYCSVAGISGLILAAVRS